MTDKRATSTDRAAISKGLLWMTCVSKRLLVQQQIVKVTEDNIDQIGQGRFVFNLNAADGGRAAVRGCAVIGGGVVAWPGRESRVECETVSRGVSQDVIVVAGIQMDGSLKLGPEQSDKVVAVAAVNQHVARKQAAVHNN